MYTSMTRQLRKVATLPAHSGGLHVADLVLFELYETRMITYLAQSKVSPPRAVHAIEVFSTSLYMPVNLFSCCSETDFPASAPPLGLAKLKAMESFTPWRNAVSFAFSFALAVLVVRSWPPSCTLVANKWPKNSYNHEDLGSEPRPTKTLAEMLEILECCFSTNLGSLTMFGQEDRKSFFAGCG